MNEQNIGGSTAEHSDLVGGSTASRRINCPASYALEKKVPEDKSSSYAQEGSALHEIMAKLLADPDLDPYDLLPFEYTHPKEGWTYTVNEETWEQHGQVALDTFLDFMDSVEQETGGEFEYIIEKRCEMPGVPGAFGTSDVIWKCGDVSGVLDWKFGYGQVSAEENEQLQFYARAAMHSHPEMFPSINLRQTEELVSISDPREVWLTIIQPQRSKEDDTWITDTFELEDFRADLLKALVEIETQGEEARIAKGKWCDFARCKAVCPLHINPAVALGRKMAEIKDREERDEKPTNEPDFVDTLPSLLEMAETVESWAREVFARAQAIASEDAEAHAFLRENGWGLKPKRAGNLTFLVEDDKIIKRASSHGIKIDDCAPRKLVSATQMKKLFEKIGKEMPENWAHNPPSSGSTFARVYEDSEKYESNTEKVAQLASKLAHLTGE